MTQLAILARLRRQPMSVRQLSEALILDLPGIRAKLRKLSGYGLVALSGGSGPDAVYALTPDGLTLINEASPPAAGTARRK